MIFGVCPTIASTAIGKTKKKKKLETKKGKKQGSKMNSNHTSKLGSHIDYGMDYIYKQGDNYVVAS